ncbi:LacI family DNA-binding transcriptional regulator [Microbacterium sp. RD1]|uniref:LacI family DNA-binding transcriptional regulator n=1 Tax=Microbacterium sp. RD1 TaxID=3457313 RepID=UPI003FA53689
MRGPRATLQDVATQAGVSMKTVSNVVRGYRHVSPAMRERVQAAIDALGYRPNLSGRRLATGRSGMLALAIPDLRRPYFAELAHAFARISAERGYRLLLEETGGTAEGERSALHDREVGLVDGVILYPQALSSSELDRLDRDAPVVFLGEDPPPPGTDHVAIDNVAAADAAVTHLIDVLGRRRIAFLGHEIGAVGRTSALRLEGYARALDRAGIRRDDALLVPRERGDARGGEEALTNALAAGLELDALLCRDDLAALGALRALRLAGLDVPTDVAVIGWDAIELTASTVPSLTSVAADTAALVSETLDLLTDRMGGPIDDQRRRTVDFTIVFRESAPG